MLCYFFPSVLVCVRFFSYILNQTMNIIFHLAFDQFKRISGRQMREQKYGPNTHTHTASVSFIKFDRNVSNGQHSCCILSIVSFFVPQIILSHGLAAYLWVFFFQNFKCLTLRTPNRRIWIYSEIKWPKVKQNFPFFRSFFLLLNFVVGGWSVRVRVEKITTQAKCV